MVAILDGRYEGEPVKKQKEKMLRAGIKKWKNMKLVVGLVFDDCHISFGVSLVSVLFILVSVWFI